MITLDQVKNGTIWQGAASRYVVQWIDTDQWVLLAEPDKARHGGTCLIAVNTAKDHRIIRTRAQMVDLMNELDVVPLERESLRLPEK